MYPDIRRRTVLKSIGAGTVLAGAGVGTASAQGGEFSPCGVEEACDGGTFFAKFDYNEETGEFELTESNPFFDLEGVFDITIEETNEEGEPLEVCWTQDVEERYEYLIDQVRAKAGPETTPFQHVDEDTDDPSCISVDRYAISHITFCSPVLMQVDFHTGPPQEVPNFKNGENLIRAVVYRDGTVKYLEDFDSPLNGALTDDLIEISDWSPNGGGTATVNYEIPEEVIPNTDATGVTEDSVVITLAGYVRRRNKVTPLNAQILTASDTNSHQLGSSITDSLSIPLPDPYNC